MNKVINILSELESTSSRLEKEHILELNKNNELLKTVFNYAMNPFIIFGIGKKSFDSKVKGQSRFNNLIELLEYLKLNNTGLDSVKDEVNKFLNNQPIISQEWFKRIILKDLRIGVTEKTVNKIYKDLIPVFDCMLASPLENKLPKNILIEPKLDGIRVVYVNGKLFTRNGKMLEGFNEIEQQLLKLPQDFVFDGELMGSDFTATQNLTFKKSDNKTGVNFNIFDCLPITEFQKGCSSSILRDRKKTLIQVFDSFNSIIIPNLKRVEVWYTGNSDQDAIQKVHDQIISLGFEGSMIKDAESIYQCKRTKTWLKKKDFDLHDLKVVDIFEGDGKYQGTLGGVVVSYKGNTVKVGSGFNDYDRDRFWSNPELILDSIIMVQAQEESHDKSGEVSLRFPTFKGVRVDK